MRALPVFALALGVLVTTHVDAQPPRSLGTQGTRPPARRAAPGPAARPRTEQPMPFRVGETLTYDVSWSRYLVAGSAVTKVVEKRPSFDSTAYYIVAEGRPIPLISRLYSVYYKMDSLLDSYTALSQRFSLYSEEGSNRRMATTLFNRPGRKAQFEVRTTTTAKDEFPVPQDVQDGLATLYTLRRRAFKAGERLTVPVTDDGALYTARFEVTGPESVKVPLGQVQAWNVRVTVLNAAKEQVGNNIGAWFTTDARRLPVKLAADLPVGTFELALRSVDQAQAGR